MEQKPIPLSLLALCSGLCLCPAPLHLSCLACSVFSGVSLLSVPVLPQVFDLLAQPLIHEPNGSWREPDISLHLASRLGEPREPTGRGGLLWWVIAAWVGPPQATGVTDPHVYTRGCNDSVAERARRESGVSSESAHSRQSAQNS